MSWRQRVREFVATCDSNGLDKVVSCLAGGPVRPAPDGQ